MAKINTLFMTLFRTAHTYHRGPTQAASLLVCLKYKEMYGRILKSLNMVNLYQGMSKLKLKINVNLLQLLCIVVSVALHGEFERFGGFCVDCYYILLIRLIVLCEMVLCETKRNEMKSVLCEMKICTLRNENLYFAKRKSVLCEMKICTFCTLRNENLYFAK